VKSARARPSAAIAAALVVSCLAVPVWAQAPASGPVPPAATAPVEPVRTPADGAPADRDGLRDPARRGEGPRWRADAPMAAEMADRIVAVARDVSPDLAAEIERARTESPDRMAQSMRQNARRLMGLAVLKDRNPDLYAIRVEELRLQLELRVLGEQWRAATEAKDAARAEQLSQQIDAKVRSQVDVDLKARAQELVALDAQLKSLREDLAGEQRRMAERVAERIEAVKSGQPMPGRDRDRAPPPGGESGDPRRPPRPRPDERAPVDGAPSGAAGAP
jgi:hypothetical protein